jgi:hypothetical protein
MKGGFRATPAASTSSNKLIGLLRRSFDEEPMQRCLFPFKGYRDLASQLWFSAMMRDALEHGSVWELEDSSAVAVWFRPGSSDSGSGVTSKLFQVLVKLYPRTRKMKDELDHELAVRRPRSPHWYLAAVATESRLRTQGRGTAVLAPIIRACDSDGICAYLETSTPNSIPFYEAMGFSIWSEFRVSNSPRVWCMGRSPR